MLELEDFDEAKFLARLGKHIARVRKSRGFTQDRACLEAGLTRGALSKIENGRIRPQVTTLARLAIVLGVPYKKLHEVELF